MSVVRVNRLAKLATFATLIGGMTLAAGSASATPSFTWNPGGSTPGLATQPAFTADNITVKDFANIQIQNGGVNNGHFTETGILQITAFSNGSGVVSTPGLNGPSGLTSYKLYFTFSAAGVLTDSTPWPTRRGSWRRSIEGRTSSSAGRRSGTIRSGA